MGQRTDQAERDVIEQRELIGRRLSDLSGRLEHDMSEAGAQVRTQAGKLKDRAAEVADRVPGRQALEDQVPGHPLTSVVAGFGAGVALGMLRLPGGSDEPEPDRNGRDRRRDGRGRRDDDSGLVDRLSGIALASLAGPLQRQLSQLASEAMSGFKGREAHDSGKEATRPESIDPPR